jgi:mevalonate kinase
MKAVAEAPSKAIITGEHFVVHGAWALAAALPRKVRAEIRPASSLLVTSDRFRNERSPELRPIVRVVERMAKDYSVASDLRVSIASEVPGGAGLGSSAATLVAVASAFSRFHSLGLGIGEVIRLAMVGEMEIHGKPSGIDPTVCAKGGVILYRRGSAPKKVRLPGPCSLLVSYSGINRSTKGQIGQVSRVRAKLPGLFSALVSGISELSLSAADALGSGDREGLGHLLAVNQAVLGSMGVSNGTIDGMVDLMGSLGCYGAKLTGAGGGGSVIAVCPEAKEKSIASGLTARGFETFRAKIPVEGVRSWLER